jgi:hypothetical protein
MEEAESCGVSMSHVWGQSEKQEQGTILSVREEGIILMQVPQLRLQRDPELAAENARLQPVQAVHI